MVEPSGRKKHIVKATRPPVDVATIPDHYVYENYVSRTFPSGRSDFDVADHCLHHGKNLLIEGPTGPGKTTFAKAFAAKRKKRFYALPCSIGVDPTQIIGKYIPNPRPSGPRWIWADGAVTTIFRWGGVLLINEINMLSQQLAGALFSALDDNRSVSLLEKDGEVVRAHRPTKKNARGEVVSRCWCDHPDDIFECRPYWVLIMADMNPGYEGTRPLSKALANRFQIHLSWDYDPNVEKELLVSDKVRELAGKLRDQQKLGRYSVPIPTNALMEFEQAITSMGLDFAAMCFVNRFPESERPDVQLVVNTHLADIEQEVLAATTVREIPDFAKMTEAQKKAWRLTLKPGDVDPEWGVFMGDGADGKNVWEWVDPDEDGE